LSAHFFSWPRGYSSSGDQGATRCSSRGFSWSVSGFFSQVSWWTFSRRKGVRVRWKKDLLRLREHGTESVHGHRPANHYRRNIRRREVRNLPTEAELIFELKDYTDKLFHKEGGRADTESFGGIWKQGIGMHKRFSSWFGPLHLSLPTCRDCPQYGEKLVYARKCYYAKQCGWPAFIGIPIVKVRLKFRKIRVEAKVARAYRLLGWEL